MLIRPEILKHLTDATDSESSRYALGGIQLERDETGTPHAVASDGRILVHATWPDPFEARDFPSVSASAEPVEGFSAIVPAKACIEASKLPPKRSPKPILEYVVVDENSNGKVTFVGTDLEAERAITTRTIEGKFPNWRDVVTPIKPDAPNVTRVTLDPYYVATACRILQRVGCTAETSGVDILIPDNGESGVRFQAHNSETGVTVEAVVMPMARDR